LRGGGGGSVHEVGERAGQGGYIAEGRVRPVRQETIEKMGGIEIKKNKRVFVNAEGGPNL